MAHTKILVTDLGGRAAPFVTDFDGLELPDNLVEEVLDGIAAGHPVCIGEIQYSEAPTS